MWSDGTTTFNGTILATGGPRGGNGGWVETSGEGILNVGASAAVTAGSPRGNPGTWLLDPNSNVDITNSTTNDVCTGGLNCAPSADTSSIAASAATSNANGLGAGNNVLITTTCGAGQYLHWKSGGDHHRRCGDHLVDIRIADPERRQQAIAVDAAITGASGTLVLTAGGTISQTAAISVGTLTTSSVGGTTLGGANAIGTFSATNTGSGNISLTDGAANLLISSVSQSGGGNVTLTNSGNLVVERQHRRRHGHGDVDFNCRLARRCRPWRNDVITAGYVDREFSHPARC